MIRSDYVCMCSVSRVLPVHHILMCSIVFRASANMWFGRLSKVCIEFVLHAHLVDTNRGDTLSEMKLLIRLIYTS